MKRIFIYILPLILLFLSCSDEKTGGTLGPNPKGTPMSFTVSLPSQAQPTTYALTETDENAVGNIHVLVFEDDGGIMKLADWAEAVPGSIQDDGVSNKKRFTVNFSRLTKNTVSYQFVIVANAKYQVEDLFDVSGITIGALKTTTMSILKLTGINRWIADSGDNNYRPIPMWGESGLQTVSDNMSVSGLKLLRMIAKIDVVIGNLAQSKFKLKSVHLYNYYTDGRIVPDAGNLVYGSTSKVENPTVTGASTKGPVLFDATTTSGSVTDTELLNSIYTFESAVPYDGGSGEADLEKVTCLVIGGEYNNSGVTSYYRLDMANKDSNTGKVKYLDILRNHRYEITITKVKTGGYPTPEEAFKSRAINIELEIQAWDEGDLNDIVFDGQYQLAVSTDILNFFREGRAQEMSVKSDHPSGWAIEESSNPDWITITPDNDNSGDCIQISVTASPLLSTDEDREGSFYIVSGNLRKKITVVQKNEMEFTLEVFPETLIFRKSGAQGKPIKVTTYPSGLIHTMSAISDSGNDIEWITGPAEMTGGISAGTDVYTFQPKPNDSGVVRSNLVSINVIHNGVPLTRTISMRQLATDLLFDVTGKLASYPAIGNNYSLNIQSDAPWQLLTNATSDPYDPRMLTLTGDPGEQEIAIVPVPYPFSISDNTTYGLRTAYIKARSSDIDFPTQDIEIVQDFAAPYLDVPATVDLDQTTNMTVKTNAGWVFNDQAANIAELITGNTPAKDAVQAGSTSALVEHSSIMTFVKNTAVAGLPKAGTVLNAAITLKTQNHSPAAAVEKTITLSRKIPSSFTYNSLTPSSLLQAGGNITVNASSNDEWKVLSSNGTTVTQAADSYQARNLPITILPNTTWANRTVTISTQYNGITTQRVSFCQPGYHLSVAGEGLANYIPDTGGIYTFKFTTTSAHPQLTLRAIVIAAGTEVATRVTVPLRAAAGNGNHNITVQTNAGTASRKVTFQYYADGAWKDITSITQDAYDECGTRGVAKLQAIGSTGESYLTHSYGTVCWMVENSREWGYKYEYASETEKNGAYYTSASRARACPTGWYLPGESDATALYNIIKDDPDGVGRWWYRKASNAFAGYFQPAGTIYRFDNHGYWWLVSGSKTFYNNYTGDFLSSWEFGGSGHAFTARCLKP